MHPETPDDDGDIHALYQLTRGAQHTPRLPQAVEARILAAARAPARRRSPVYARWASAAVLLLAIGVVWQGWRGPALDPPARAPRPAPDAPAAKRMEQTAAPAMRALPAAEAPPAPRQSTLGASADAELRSDAPAHDAPLAAEATVGRVAMPQAASTSDAAPAGDPRLRTVRELLREGRQEEARAALTELRSRYPDLVLDTELRELLGSGR